MKNIFQKYRTHLLHTAAASCCFFIFLFQTFAQNNFYWIKFKDKNHNQCSLSNPLQFISWQSLIRRQGQHIGLDESDLPVTQIYIDSISPFIDELHHRIKWFNMVVVQINDSAKVDSIKKFSFVDSIAGIEFIPKKNLVQQNKFENINPVDQSIVYPNEYGVAYNQANMLNVDLLHQLNFKGQEIIIAMMDNGFFNADSIAGFDSVRQNILGTWDFVHNRQDVYNDGGHGTSTFSCIAGNIPGKFTGTAPSAKFYLLESEDNSKEWIMEEYNWAAAAEFADSVGAQIFSTSLGYTEFDNGIGNHTWNDLNGNTTIITRAGNAAAGKGIIVLNSAGNEGGFSWLHISAPSDGDSIICVGAVDSARTITNFSGRGFTNSGKIKPDMCAQGARSGVLNTAGIPSTSNGTSFSCPILAGAYASLWSAFPNKTAEEVKVAVLVSCDKFWTPDSLYGYGIPNFYNAYLLLKTNYNENIIQLNDDVRIFPNPFSDELNISLYSDTAAQHTIEIFDMQGRKVFSKTFPIRTNTFEILNGEELKTLAAGEYLLRYDGWRKFTHRIIKGK